MHGQIECLFLKKAAESAYLLSNSSLFAGGLAVVTRTEKYGR